MSARVQFASQSKKEFTCNRSTSKLTLVFDGIHFLAGVKLRDPVYVWLSPGGLSHLYRPPAVSSTRPFYKASHNMETCLFKSSKGWREKSASKTQPYNISAVIMGEILNYLLFSFIQKQVKGPSDTQWEKLCESHKVGIKRGHIRVCFLQSDHCPLWVMSLLHAKYIYLILSVPMKPCY